MIKSFPTYPSVSDLVNLGPHGIKALQDAVVRELNDIKAKGNKAKINMKIIAPHIKVDMNIIVNEDDNIYDVSLHNDDVNKLLECACRGIAACSTCHVYIDPISYNKLNPIEEYELDMLELAWGYDPESSRLGCQLKFTKDVENMIITIPSNVNNLH